MIFYFLNTDVRIVESTHNNNHKGLGFLSDIVTNAGVKFILRFADKFSGAGTLTGIDS